MSEEKLHTYCVDLGSFFVEAKDEEDACNQAVERIKEGDVEIDQIIDEGEVED